MGQGTLLLQDTFVSDGTNKTIELPGNADYFVVKNITQSGAQQTSGRGVAFEWFKGFANGEQIRTFKSNNKIGRASWRERG